MSTRPTPPVQRPLPIQNFQLKKEDFSTEDGVSRINTMLQSLITNVQAVQGSAGPSVLPSGVDVQGARVSGLGAPQNPSDAISSAHADSNYSAPVVGPQLDIGGKNALKGLTLVTKQAAGSAASIIAIQTALAAGVSGTVPLAKLTGGGTNGSITFVGGIISGFVLPT